MNKAVRRKIRQRLIEHFPPHTVTFIFSGLSIRKSADANYPFHANRNFLYATGIEEEAAILVFDNGNEILFLRDVDPGMEKWNGHYMRIEEAQEISGIKDVRYFEGFEAYLEKILSRKTRIGLDLDQNHFSETAYGSAVSMADYVGIERVIDVTEIFVRSRMLKFPEEVEAIKHAAVISDIAIKSMLHEMKPGNNENDMASKFLYEAHKHQGGLMFDTIIASGKEATVLHYIENNQELKDGELVLMDLGVCVNGYGADISLTYPVNGTYSPRQKEVYEVVLETYEAVIAAIRPGVSLLELNELAKEKLAQGCRTLGLIKSNDEIDRYYYHSIGHSLGLDTHDVWTSRDFPLEAGNVITVEPGLYIEEESIGIRIETDILVTETGSEDLAPQTHKGVEEVEAYLKSIQ